MLECTFSLPLPLLHAPAHDAVRSRVRNKVLSGDMLQYSPALSSSQSHGCKFKGTRSFFELTGILQKFIAKVILLNKHFFLLR